MVAPSMDDLPDLVAWPDPTGVPLAPKIHVEVLPYESLAPSVTPQPLAPIVTVDRKLGPAMINPYPNALPLTDHRELPPVKVRIQPNKDGPLGDVYHLYRNPSGAKDNATCDVAIPAGLEEFIDTMD
jgi:hypothetical protein